MHSSEFEFIESSSHSSYLPVEDPQYLLEIRLNNMLQMNEEYMAKQPMEEAALLYNLTN